MSICRWSTDSFRCPLYIYESDLGFELHIARRCKIGITDRPTMKNLKYGGKNITKFIRRTKTWDKAYKKLKSQELNLEYAGQSFIFHNGEECAEFVRELIELGYQNIPKYVLQELEEA